MSADDAALDDGFWDSAFLNQWLPDSVATRTLQRNSLASVSSVFRESHASEKDQPFVANCTEREIHGPAELLRRSW